MAKALPGERALIFLGDFKLISGHSTYRPAWVLLVLSLFLSACSSDSEQAAEHLRKADVYLAKNNTRAATIELKNALQLTPDDASGRLKLGRIYLDQGRGIEALKELQRARKFGSKAPQLSLFIVRSMLLAGQFTEALAEIKSSGKTGAQWLILKGNAHLGLEAIDKARSAYQQALQAQPGEPAAQRGLARIAMLTGDNNAAQGYISKALDSGKQEVQTLLLKGELELSLKHYADAEQSFLKALELSPNLPTAHLGAAQALLAQNKPDRAHTHIAALQSLKLGGPQVSYLKALEARLKNNPEQAISALREVLKVIPDHAPSLLLLGQIHYQRRELDQAQSRLEQYVAKAPRSAAGRKLLAAVYLELNQADKAIGALRPVEKSSPDDPQTLSLLGTAFMQKGDFEKGKQYLGKAKKQAPNAAAINTQLAISHLATGESDAAIKELETAIASDPKFERADYLVILTYLRKGDKDAALRAVNKLIEKDPKNPIAHNLMGAVHEVNKDYAGARASYRHVLELDPKSRAAMLNLARLDFVGKNSASAKQQLEAILKIYPDDAMALMGLARLASDQGNGKQGIAYLQQAIQKNPNSLQPRLVLGNYNLRTGKLDKALALAREARTLAPENPASLLLLGRAQLSKGRTREAIATLSQLVQLAPKAALGHFYLAMAQRRAGDTGAARDSLNKARQLEPKNALVLAALGELENVTGNTEAAGKIAGQLAAQLPDAPVSEVLRGDILSRQGQYAKAIPHYQKAFDRGQNSALLAKLFSAHRQAGHIAKARSLLSGWLDSHPDDLGARVLLASADQQDGRQDRAIANYEAIIKRVPGHVIALNNLAWLYYQHQDKRALEYARRAYEGLPDRAEIIDTYGWMLVEDGQVERGLRLLDQAVAGAPDNGDIAYHRAAALNRAGDLGRARAELEQLLSKNKEFTERESAQALLEKLKGK